MIIKLHQGTNSGEILVQTERISIVQEVFVIDFDKGMHVIGSEIIMNDCEYTHEGHKMKIKIRVSESVSEIYELIHNQ